MRICRGQAVVDQPGKGAAALEVDRSELVYPRLVAQRSPASSAEVTSAD